MKEDMPAPARVPLSYQQKMMIDFQARSEQPSKAAAYLLCVFLGGFGAHRLYLGERRTGLAMLALGLTVVGLPLTVLWAIRDLFWIPDVLRQRLDETRQRLTARAIAGETEP